MQAVCLVALANAATPLFACLMIPILAMWIFGVHGMLTGTATMDFGGTRGAATVTGMLDGVQYIASTICVFGMGWLLESSGWTYWAYVLIPFSLIGAALMLTIWNERPHKKAA
jgi:OPA family glycerol-3-phosphate transporter-like MFS transporter